MGNIDCVLNEIGIECNYVHGQWTGVSLNRYKKLIEAIAKEIIFLSNVERPFNESFHSAVYPHVGAYSAMLQFVWVKANSKQCLLDFLLGIESASQMFILKDEFSDLRSNGSTMQKQWLEDKFSLTDLTFQKVQKATEVLLRGNADSDPCIGQAIECIAASLAYDRAFKPPIKLGRYSYGDGPEKPDCVEVVIREVMDTLLFGMLVASLKPLFF